MAHPQTAGKGGNLVAAPETLRVSVLIPTYNQATYLVEALESAFTQSLSPFEVVVVDDGSTDDTPRALEPFLDRIRYHRQENSGISGARNRCVQLAEGEAIAFLDSDDLWPKRSLEARAKALERDPDLDGVAGIVEQFLSPDIPEELQGRYHVPPEVMVARFAGSLLLRREVFQAIGGFDPALGLGDTLDWLARAEAGGIRIGSVKELVLRRRIHGQNTSTRMRDRRSDYLRVLKRALDRKRSSRQGGDRE